MSRKHVGLLLLSAFCIVAIVMNVILFRAGTIGDTKSGSFGDPVRALAVEDYALYMLIPAAALLGSSVYFLLGGSSRARILCGRDYIAFASRIVDIRMCR